MMTAAVIHQFRCEMMTDAKRYVGFALQRLDEQAAQETLELFRQMGELDAEFGDQWGRAAEQAGVPAPDDTDETGGTR